MNTQATQTKQKSKLIYQLWHKARGQPKEPKAVEQRMEWKEKYRGNLERRGKHKRKESF